MVSNSSCIESEVKQKIMNAASALISQYGYNKATTAEIAAKAGVSKGTIFYYFGSKKNLYLSAVHYYLDLLSEELSKECNDHIRISDILKIQVKLTILHPYMLDFLKMVYADQGPALFEELYQRTDIADNNIIDIILHCTDLCSNYTVLEKDAIIRILHWCTEGYIKELKKQTVIDASAAFDEFNKYVEILRKVSDSI